MQLTLTLDVGNSNPHVGWFIDGELKQVTPLSELTEVHVDSVGARKINAIASRVGADLNLDWLSPTDVSSFRTMKEFLGMPMKYAGTLGADRLVQIFYQHEKNNNESAIIDAGTFTTVDLLSKNGHEGGLIFPGIKTYLEAYKQKGAKLPLLNLDQIDFDSKANPLALNTYSAIGESYKVVMESIAQTVLRFGPKRVFLTGGHGHLYKSLFTDAHYDAHAIHYALFYAYQRARDLGRA